MRALIIFRFYWEFCSYISILGLVTEDFNQLFEKTYDIYAKAPVNLFAAHIENNYEILLKIFPHKDSTPQNPKINWSSIKPLQNDR